MSSSEDEDEDGSVNRGEEAEDHNDNVSSSDEESEFLPPLFRAIQKSNIEKIQSILDARREHNASSCHDDGEDSDEDEDDDLLSSDSYMGGFTPLHYLCFAPSERKVEICKLLIDYLEDEQERTKDDDEPAINWLEHGAGPDENIRPLILAVKSRRVPLVKYLLQRGANPLAGEGEDGSALHWAVKTAYRDMVSAIMQATNDNKDLQRKLLTAGDEEGDTSLHMACFSVRDRSVGIVEQLLEWAKKILKTEEEDGGVAVDDSADQRPCVSCGGKDTAVMTLKEFVQCRNFEEDTPLHLIKHTEKIKLLVQVGGSGILNLKNEKGNTPLHSFSLSPIILRALLDHGAGVRVHNQDGNMPIHIACEGDNDDDQCVRDSIDAFLQHDSTLVDGVNSRSGWTPVQAACSNGKLEVVTYLMQNYRPSVGNIDRFGNTTLHLAAINRTYEDSKTVQLQMLRAVYQYASETESGAKGVQPTQEKEETCNDDQPVTKKPRRCTSSAREMLVTRNVHGESPLMSAARSAHLNVIDELVRYQILTYGTLYLPQERSRGFRKE